MFHTFIFAFPCSTHSYSRFHVPHIHICVPMFHTFIFAFPCSTHSYFHSHVPHIHISVPMFHTFIFPFPCSTHSYFRSHVPHIHISIPIYCHSHSFILKFAVPSRHVPYIQFISIPEAATEADQKRRKLCYKDPSLSASDSTQVWNAVLNQDKPSAQDIHKALMLGEQDSLRLNP